MEDGGKNLKRVEDDRLRNKFTTVCKPTNRPNNSKSGSTNVRTPVTVSKQIIVGRTLVWHRLIRIRRSTFDFFSQSVGLQRFTDPQTVTVSCRPTDEKNLSKISTETVSMSEPNLTRPMSCYLSESPLPLYKLSLCKCPKTTNFKVSNRTR